MSMLQEIGPVLMDIHSQMEHIYLLKPWRQLDLLDTYGGLVGSRGLFKNMISELRDIYRELDSFDNGTIERQRELLEYHIAEVDAANLILGEDEALDHERHVLQRAHMLKQGCYSAYSSLYADDPSAEELLENAIKSLRGIISIDSSLMPLLESLESATAEIVETAQELRRYVESVEARSDQIAQVEKRLELLGHLKSKYGPTIQDVLDFADRSREELDALNSQDERRCYLEDRRIVLRNEAGALAEEISMAREQACRRLTNLVNEELTDLGMPSADFVIGLKKEECPEGLPAFQGSYAYNQYGIDQVEFLAATNPSEPLRPLSDIASGGETCRFMLALNSALRNTGSANTLVFDEIDAGIGGRNAQTIGSKLAALSQDRQVICITHLPQIASYGHNHYLVQKDVISGRSMTRVEDLEGESRLEELSAMLGSGKDDYLLESVQKILHEAESKREECVTVSS